MAATSSRQATPDVLGAMLTGGAGALKQLRATEIRLDGGTQPRAGVDPKHVQELAADVENGAVLPPLDVTYDGAHYWLWDGYHRLAAWRKLRGDGVLVDVRVHQGSQADAQWASYAANRAHGLRRTNEDKARAVQAALKHPNGASRSNREIGRYLGVDEGTVRHWREKLEAGAEIPQVTQRTGADGKTYDTAGIGAAQQAQAAAAAQRQASTNECIAAVWRAVKAATLALGAAERLQVVVALQVADIRAQLAAGFAADDVVLAGARLAVETELRKRADHEARKEARRAAAGGRLTPTCAQVEQAFAEWQAAVELTPSGLQDLRVRWTAAPLWTQMLAAVMAKCKTVVGIKEEWLQQVIDAALAASVGQPGPAEAPGRVIASADRVAVAFEDWMAAEGGAGLYEKLEDLRRHFTASPHWWRLFDFLKQKLHGAGVNDGDLLACISGAAEVVRPAWERETAAGVAQPGQARQSEPEPAEPTMSASGADERTEKLHRLKLTFMHSMDALTLWSEMTGRYGEVSEAKRGLRKVIDRTSDLIDGKFEESEEVTA